MAIIPIFLLIHSLLLSFQYKLGHFPEEWFREEVPHQLIADFQKDLESLSDIIEERNASLQLPYTYLSPENVDNSVAI